MRSPSAPRSSTKRVAPTATGSRSATLATVRAAPAPPPTTRCPPWAIHVSSARRCWPLSAAVSTSFRTSTSSPCQPNGSGGSVSRFRCATAALPPGGATSLRKLSVEGLLLATPYSRSPASSHVTAACSDERTASPATNCTASREREPYSAEGRYRKYAFREWAGSTTGLAYTVGAPAAASATTRNSPSIFRPSFESTAYSVHHSPPSPWRQ